MARVALALRSGLEEELRHRLRPMSGQDPRARGRQSTPLELLYDLTYVIAFGAAAEQLAHHISQGEAASATGAYVFAVFSISWAWLNFTWFASAYGNDDALLRVATIVQMVGVVILIFGLPVSFEAAAHGESPNNALLVIGYIIMRVPLIALWLRAARQDPAHRAIATAYAVMIAVAQVIWALTAILPLPTGVTITVLALMVLAEATVPVVAEKRLGAPPWNPGHIAERFSLLTLITLGEVIAATVAAVGSLVEAQGWSLAAVVIAASGIILAAALWWAYFLVPSRLILEIWPQRVYAWRYAHLPMFGAIAAVGAGLRVAAAAVEERELSALQIALALAVPVGVVVLLIFVMWSILLRARDLTHVPLFVASIVPLFAAVAVGALAGTHHLDPDDPTSLGALGAVIALVALCGIAEVIGHEIVGYPHTLRALEAGPEPAAAPD